MKSALTTDLIKIWKRQRSKTPDNTDKSDLDLLMEFLINEVKTEFRVKITRDALGSEKFYVNKSSKYNDSKSVPTACELLTTSSYNKNNTNSKFKKVECIFVINHMNLKIVMMHFL